MTKIYVLIIALCMFAGNGLYAQTTQGTDFWIAFGKNANRTSKEILFQIKIVTTNATQVKLTFSNLPASNRTINIPAGTTHTINLSDAEEAAVSSVAEGTAKQSLHITSDKPVSVYALNAARYTSDATNILPKNVLGTDYYHISYAGTGADHRDAMTLVATENYTTVTCTLKGSSTGTSKTLHMGDVWYIQGATNTADMTGAHVVSDKPIAHFATHQSAMIPDVQMTNGDHLFQQLAPTTSWGKSFYVPDIGIQDGQYPLLLRIVASQNDTKITKQGGGTSSLSLNKGEFVTLPVSRYGCYISSDKPVGVCSYLLSYEKKQVPNTNTYTYKTFGGPAEVWIPPIEQGVASTTVSSFSTYADTIYAVIVTRSSTRGNTTVKTGNGETLILSDASWTALNYYSFTRYKMTSDVPHTFSNPAGLTVLVFGLGTDESYYYLGGSSMYSLEMNFSVNGINYQEIFGKTICPDIALKATLQYANNTVQGYLKWYIDDVLKDAATDKTEWNATLSPGAHTIRMEALSKDGQRKSISTDIFVEKPVASITGPVKISAGKTTTLSPATGGTWKSNDEKIATVDNKGIVTGVSQGETYFTFTSNAGCIATTGTVEVTGMYAVNDTVSLVHNSSVDVDALANDVLSCGKDKISLDTIAGSGLHHGSLEINGDATFTYKAEKGVYGIDSVEYSATCEGNTVKAKIYFVISKPLSEEYMACENAKFSTGMHPVAGVEYFWYDSEDNLIYNEAKNEIDLIKDASESQKFYAETRYAGKTLNRIMFDVLLSRDCGLIDPAGCAIDGQLLFSEDFGGNDVSDKEISPNALPAETTDYAFDNTDKPGSDKYALVKYIGTDFSDHTSPGEKDRGYMFLVNASKDAGKLYEAQITGLCDNMNKLYFSAWIVNITPSESAAADDPALRFELLDEIGNIVGTYITSDIPRDPKGGLKWRNYGFMFNPQGHDSLTFRIYKQGQASNGSEFAMDDIEVRFCTPPVTMENRTVDTACVSTSYTFKASYTDSEGVFSGTGELTYCWEYSQDGYNWTVIGTDSTIAATSVQSAYTIDSVTNGDEGYYRFAVGSPTCRVISPVTTLFVSRILKATDLR
ncbi:MAG: Ig-like domain-containing protein, partial [Prevotellaceae bacterium]|nr:Ig-like domain-containing protein [Prevotellaceae bacterium]